jgi:hypothetical protein
VQNENIIATLEQSLRQTHNQRSKLVNRLNEIEAEAEGLRQEIETLDNIATQTEDAIYSLVSASRAGRAVAARRASNRNELENEAPSIQPPQRFTAPAPNYQPPPNTNYQPPRQINNTFQMPKIVPVKQSNRTDVPEIKHEVVVRSNRLADRTITQACTMLLREAGGPLHVNELYNSLLEEGFEFHGNNPTISIAVSLNRNRRFRKVAPGTFDLVIRDAKQAAS